MASNTTKKIAVSLLLFFFILAVVLLSARWFVKSGRLKAYVEKRAGEATHTNVRMRSLQLAWPPRVEIKDFVMATPGYEDAPLLTCPRITVTGKIGNMVKSHADTVVLISPEIRVTADRQGGSNASGFALSEGGSLSVGTAKIIDASIDLDSPELKMSSRGVLVTLSSQISPAGVEKIAKLDIDAIDATIFRENEEPVPFSLRLIQSKFVQRDKLPGSEIEGEIHAGLGAEPPYLRLPPDIPVNLTFECDYFPKRDSLENGLFNLTFLPSTRVRVYGSVEGLTSGAPSPNLKVTVSPLEIETLYEYVEPLKRPKYEDIKLSGKVRLSADIGGNLASPKVSVRARADQGRLEWRGFSMEDFEFEAPLTLEGGTAAMQAGRVSAAKAVVPIGKEAFEITSLKGIISGDESRVTMRDATAKLGNVSEVSFEGEFEPKSGIFSGNARMADTPVAEALAYASPIIGALPDDVAASGRFDVDLDINGGSAEGQEALDARYRLALRQGEVSSGELFAAAGIDGAIEGKIEMGSADRSWKFDGNGQVGEFELLFDTFYKDFSDNRLPFSLSGEFAPKSRRLKNARATVDLGPIGKIAADGDIGFDSATGIAMKLTSDGINLNELFEQAGKEILSEIVADLPDLDEAEIGGIASGEVDVKIKGKAWKASGSARLADGVFRLADGAFGIDSLSVDLPFDVYFPQEEDRAPLRFAPEDFGNVKIDGLVIGPVDIPSLDLDVALKENALRIPRPAPLEIFGGTTSIGTIEAKSVFGSGATLTTTLSAKNIELEEVTQKLGLPRVVGTLNADFPGIIARTETLVADGAATAHAFGGTIEVTSLEIENPASSVRTLEADLEFAEIDLSTVTNVLGFGSINGVMEGTLTGLEMSQGQAAAFTADFQTVKRKGVRQRINLDAVENITILGTGQGFQMGVGRGLAMFFEEFGYDSIGFFCTLKNDNFRMRGKTVRGDTEYFVKGVMVGPQINVINRNPGQTISFKSMIERINRIGTKSVSEGY
jgi:hypothetical protein